MSKNPMVRNLGRVIAFSMLFSTILTPTVSAENNSVNEQDIDIRAGATAILSTIDTEVIENTNYNEVLTGYTTTSVNVRTSTDTEKNNIIDQYDYNTEFTYHPIDNSNWGLISEEDELHYICLDYVSDEEQKEIENENETVEYYWSGEVLNRSNGTVYGPSGRETYYNLPMNNVVFYMRELGYDYQYWVRADGAKMYGDYVMVAANLNIYPKGTIVPTTLGMGIVCDTGGFASSTNVALDVATSW